MFNVCLIYPKKKLNLSSLYIGQWFLLTSNLLQGKSTTLLD